MDGADVAIFADSIVADRIDLSRQGPLRTEQVATDGSDCLAERFGILSEAHRFDFYTDQVILPKAEASENFRRVTRRRAAGFFSDARSQDRCFPPPIYW